MALSRSRAALVRRLMVSAGLGTALMGWVAPADAQVTRNFVAIENPLWTLPGNWTPLGVPSALDRVRFGLGGPERWMQMPEAGDASVKVITVAPLLGGSARYRFDLGEGTLRATAINVPNLIVGQGSAATVSELAIQHGDLVAGLVVVSGNGPGSMRVESGEAGFARLFADELQVGGPFPGHFAIDGRVEVNHGRLPGDVVFASGAMEIANGGHLDVDGLMLIGLDRLGRSRPATLNVAEFSSATVGSMLIGDLATVSTRVLILDPGLRGVTPALGVVGDFELSALSGMDISDALIQREGATLKIAKFAGESPFGLIGGTAELAGTFILTFAPGFDPELGSEFPLLAAVDGVTGRWTVSYLPGLTDGRFLTIDYPPRGATPTVLLGVDQLDQILDYDDPEDGIEIPSGPTAAVMGDFNNDGKPDVAIAFADPDEPLTAPGSVAILLNQGVDETGWLGFASQITLTVLNDPRAIDVADFDLDGNLDVIVAGYTAQAVQVAFNHGKSGWTVQSPVALSSGPVDVKTADFTSDGRPDAVVALPDTESVQRLTNELRAAALIPQLPQPAGLVVDAVDPFDPDADKDSDVGGAGGASGRGVAGQAFVMTNTGEGFSGAEITDVGDAPVDIASGDFDGDGFPELVTVDFGSDTVSVLVNDGSGGFSQAFSLPVGGEPRSITVNDLDGDDDLDIAVVAESVLGRVVQILRNDTQSVGDLVFAPVSELPAGPSPSIVLSADLNGDKRVDLVAINPQGPRGVDGGQVTVLLSKSSPRCPADFTGNGVVNAQDLTAFLQAWFRDLEQGSYVADFNRDSVVNSTDVSEFVNAYLNSPEGCLG